MRLIDADAFLKEYCEPYPHIYQAMSSAFKHAPTVEAIPIEYIKNQIDRWERSKCESYHAICYRHLIEEWKMENERKEE